MEELPEGLNMEILRRLPVKSLLRCKCLSKSWLSLISNPNFTKLLFNQRSSSHRFLYTSPSQIWSMDINASFHDDSATIKLDFPLIKPDTDVNIISSCRGFLLLMLVKEEQLFLWNPTTSQHKQIPKPPLQWISTISFGFCYDESTDEYLVVAFSCNDPSGVKSFEIFTLRTNSWQKPPLSYQLPQPTMTSPPVRTGCFLHGAIHWLILPRDMLAATIIAFDITTKYLQEIPTPADDNYMNYDLQVLGGCLTLAAYHKFNINGGIGIWKMREYGVKSSWTKFISLSCHWSRIGYIFPLCFTNDGEIIAMHARLGLSKWSDEKGELLESLPFRDRPHKPWVVYSETLLSLPVSD